MRQTILICMMVLVYCHAYTQQGNNWMFGENVGLQFSGSDIDTITNNMFAQESSASISDLMGNALFYTNGENVWNSINEVMENGDSLIIGQNYSGDFPSSITQGVLILNDPESINKYYLFQNYNDTMLYSFINMEENSGLGKVMNKNQIFYSTFFITEKMQAVKHANGRDWWLLLYEWPDVLAGDTNFIFDKFLITPDGISDPIQQVIGPTYHIEYGDPTIGQMKFNQEGNMLAFTSGKNVDLYDFDRCTGELSNWIQIPNVQGSGTYGCEFSPDGTKLYIGGYGSDLSTKVIQYCLDCEEPIPDTKKVIFQNIYNDHGVGQFQLAPDGKIYITICVWWNPNYVYSDINERLSVINNPNEEGMSCDFDTLTIDLGGHRNLGGLPNMPNYNLGVLVGSGCDTITAINNAEVNKKEITLYPNPGNEKIYFNTDLTTPVSIIIFDLYGNKIKKIENKVLNELDINFLPQGSYIIQINNENSILLRENFIKLNN